MSSKIKSIWVWRLALKHVGVAQWMFCLEARQWTHARTNVTSRLHVLPATPADTCEISEATSRSIGLAKKQYPGINHVCVQTIEMYDASQCCQEIILDPKHPHNQVGHVQTVCNYNKQTLC